MLISMTGHGQALLHDGPCQVFAEIRAVNNRFLKVNIIGELSAEQHAEIEQTIRQFVHRGTVTVRIQTDRAHDPDQFRINAVALAAYRRQLAEHFPDDPIPLSALIGLPGVIDDSAFDRLHDMWPTVCRAVVMAVERLHAMRRSEGEAMRATLLSNLVELNDCLGQIERRAPQVVQHYRQRLAERLGQLLAEHSLTAPQVDVLREVGLFAERVDVAEEIVRMKSHVQQCQQTVNQGEGGGRKLDFLTQELLREANTIGSKSNDAAIAQHVVEMKTVIERMRELVQNVE